MGTPCWVVNTGTSFPAVWCNSAVCGLSVECFVGESLVLFLVSFIEPLVFESLLRTLEPLSFWRGGSSGIDHYDVTRNVSVLPKLNLLLRLYRTVRSFKQANQFALRKDVAAHRLHQIFPV